MRTLEIGVGLFIIAAVVALSDLAFRVSDVTLKGSRPTYRLFAEFSNVADLGPRAKVSVAGVLVACVTRVSLDPITLSVRLDIDSYMDTGYVAEDSIAAIETSGLLRSRPVFPLPAHRFVGVRCRTPPYR